MTADYQLRYAVMGMLGSFWANKLDGTSRLQARVVANVSANAGALEEVDVAC